jgi:hypothetical protein
VPCQILKEKENLLTWVYISVSKFFDWSVKIGGLGSNSYDLKSTHDPCGEIVTRIHSMN